MAWPLVPEACLQVHTPYHPTPSIPLRRARRRGSSQFIIPQQQPGAEITFPEVAFDDSGARLKVMRHVQFGPAFYPLTRKVGAPDGAPSPCFDLGVGAQLEFDTAAVQAKVRRVRRGVWVVVTPLSRGG